MTRPTPEHVSRTVDPLTGRVTNRVRCPECAKEFAARGWGAHWRIMHDPDGGSPLMPAASGRRKFKEPKPDAAPGPQCLTDAERDAARIDKSEHWAKPQSRPEPKPESDEWGW